jgi:hypothetical protein
LKNLESPDRDKNTSAVSPRQLPGLMPVACAAFLVSLVFAVLAARSLYDDGSYYFLRALQAGGFKEMVYSRDYADYLYQLPLALALKLGITNLAKLQIAFGIGCFMSWPLAMGMCLRLAPRHFWLVVLACGAGYLNAAFSAVAEHIVAHAFFWPVCFAILFARPLKPAAAAMMLVSAAILVRSYESMLFLGPPLAWLAFRRAAGGGEKSWTRVAFLVAAIMLLASAPVALDGILHPGHGSNVHSFDTGFFSVLASPGWTICWTIFWVLLMLAGWPAKVRAWIAHPAGVMVLGAIILLWGAWPLLMPAHLDVYKQYEARFLDLCVPMALLGVALILAHRPAWLESQRSYLVNMSAGLLLAQSLWHVAATEQWRTYLDVWRNLMAEHTGIIKLTDTPYGKSPAVGRQATRFVWEMDALNMCVEIGPLHVKSLILPDYIISDGIVNRNLLNEFKPEELPQLERYGVDFSEYIQAVTNSPLLDDHQTSAK